MIKWLGAFLRSPYLRVVLEWVKKLQDRNIRLSSTDLEDGADDDDDDEEWGGEEGGRKERKKKKESE